MVNFKTTKTSFKDKNRKFTSPDEHVIFEDKHEPIIDRETWETAKRIRQNARRRRPDSLGEPHPLSGLLYCADCGAKLYNERGLTRQGKPKDNYHCASFAKHTTDCTMHRIRADVVKELVLETLRRASAYARENEAEFLRRINETFSAQQAGTIKAQKKKLIASQKRRAELDRLIQRIYEDNIASRITDKRFEVLSRAYENEQDDLEKQIAELQAETEAFDDSSARAASFLELTRRYRDFSKLTAPMLHEFVQKIVVHERAEKHMRHTTQKVEIFLNFIGKFEAPGDEPEAADPATIAEREAKEKLRLYYREYHRKRRANGGKPLTPADTRTPEQKAADEAAKREKQKAYNREYQREYQRKLARQKREAAQATTA